MGNGLKKDGNSGEMGVDPESCVQDSRPRSPLNGQPVPRGRPKGLQNKVTKTFKQAAEEAFTTYKNDRKGIKGGVEWLQSLMDGTASDRAAVLGLFGRLIPAQLVGEVDHRVKVELSWLGQRAIAKDTVDMESPAALTNDPSKSLIGKGMGVVDTVEDVSVRQPRDTGGDDDSRG